MDALLSPERFRRGPTSVLLNRIREARSALADISKRSKISDRKSTQRKQ
ncbi:hypothetical protein [Phormidesmis priestleyi]